MSDLAQLVSELFQKNPRVKRFSIAKKIVKSDDLIYCLQIKQDEVEFKAESGGAQKNILYDLKSQKYYLNKQENMGIQDVFMKYVGMAYNDLANNAAELFQENK